MTPAEHPPAPVPTVEPQRVAVPAPLVQRLWLALALCVASLALTTLQGIAREGYDSWHQAVSALSLGTGGWLQMLNLIAFGVVLLFTVPAWRGILVGGKGAVAYPVLTALTGLSFVAVGLIPQDPAPGYDPAGLNLQAPTPTGLAHLAFAAVAASSSVAGLFVIAARLAGDSAWKGWALSASLTALAVVACIAVYGVWSVRASGFAGTFERAAMVIPMIWMALFLLRLHRGVPFLVALSGAQPANDRARATTAVGT